MELYKLSIGLNNDLKNTTKNTNVIKKKKNDLENKIFKNKNKLQLIEKKKIEEKQKAKKYNKVSKIYINNNNDNDAIYDINENNEKKENDQKNIMKQAFKEKNQEIQIPLDNNIKELKEELNNNNNKIEEIRKFKIDNDLRKNDKNLMRDYDTKLSRLYSRNASIKNKLKELISKSELLNDENTDLRDMNLIKPIKKRNKK
jgi:hypothetical protein